MYLCTRVHELQPVIHVQQFVQHKKGLRYTFTDTNNVTVERLFLSDVTSVTSYVMTF